MKPITAMERINKDTVVCRYCKNQSGAYSCDYFYRHGYTTVVNIKGEFDEPCTKSDFAACVCNGGNF